MKDSFQTHEVVPKPDPTRRNLGQTGKEGLASAANLPP